MTSKHPDFQTLKELFEYMKRVGEVDPMRCFSDWNTYIKFLRGCIATGEFVPPDLTEEYLEKCKKEFAD